MTISIEDLFNKNRVESCSTWKLVAFLLYCPAGILLFIFRLLLSLQYLILLAILPKAWFIRRLIMHIFFFAMGLIINSNQDNKNKSCKVVISNHSTTLDSIVMECIQPSVRITKQCKLPPILGWILGFKNLSIRQNEITDVLPKIIEDSSLPFACFPEEENTNGKVGLLKFSTWPCKLKEENLQPVIIQSTRLWVAPVNISNMKSSVWTDLFWTLFIPFTQFNIIYLPVRRILDDTESEDDYITFMKDIQKDMCHVMQVEVTSFTAQDKRDYMKRIQLEEQQRYMDNATRNHAEHPANRNAEPIQSTNHVRAVPDVVMATSTMVKQVKDVVPQVPVEVIRRDVARTQSVDATLSNILEGVVEFTPLSDEEQIVEASEQQKLAQVKREKIDEVTSSANDGLIFAGVHQDRTSSFEQKKTIILDTARRRYIQRHPQYEVS